MRKNFPINKWLVSIFLFCCFGVGSISTHADSKTSQAGITFSGDGSIEVNITLTKKDADTNELLSGAEFELYSKNGESVQIKGNFVTDEDGKIHISRLLPGEYEFVEMKSPEGYHLDSKPIPFEVDFGKTEVELTAYNKKINSTKEVDSGNEKTNQKTNGILPKTGETSSYRLIFIGVLVLIVTIYIGKKKLSWRGK